MLTLHLAPPLSDRGRRSNNEDSVASERLGNDAYFMAVADGMGGTHGGEVASRLVLSHALGIVKVRVTGSTGAADLRTILTEVLEGSQNLLRQTKAADPTLVGMGTTLSCVLSVNGAFVIGHIGDSRVYLLRGGVLTQLTVDHTHIQDYIRDTGSSPDPTVVKSMGHILSRALDGGVDIGDIYPSDGSSNFTFLEGDRLLLCSDGLITDKSEANPEHLRVALSGRLPLDEVALHLRNGALAQGSTDNISVVLAEVAGSTTSSVAPKPILLGHIWKRMFPAPKAALTLLVVLSVLLFALIVLQESNEIGRFLSSTSLHNEGGSAGTSPQASTGEWHPFKNMDRLKSGPLSELRWDGYPRPDSLFEYRVTFTRQGISSTLKVKDAQIPEGRGAEVSPGKWTVSIRAVLKDSTLVNGDSEIDWTVTP